jgi:GMP synthase (glutamine-hydrolysing)
MAQSLPVLRHIAHESAGTVETSLRDMGVEFHYVDLYAAPVDHLDLSSAPGLIVLGGPMNVDEVGKYPYLAHEVQWIRQAIAAGLPVLGVCLGAQLLAKALGSKVYQNPVKEVGWYQAELTSEADRDYLFAGCGKQISVFHWHGDTFDLPAGTIRLAEGELCRNQAFRYGSSAYGLQFHIEMNEELIDSWLEKAEESGEFKNLDYIDLDKIRMQTATELPSLEALAGKILGRFIRLCAK